MNDSEMLNVQQIIRKGNANLARVWLQGTFLCADISEDILLVECTLSRIESFQVSTCESGREALDRVYLILDDMNEMQPDKGKLMKRWLLLDHQYNYS
jgi:hypothetical protein